MPLEIASFTTPSTLLASQSGASRIELCTARQLGGTTPLLSDFRTLKSQISIPIYVMIRPRGGNFVYSDNEMKEMVRSIEEFGREGADGFVFGVLRNEGWRRERKREWTRVDREACVELTKVAGQKPCTFHRAFDEILVEDMGRELEILAEIGFKGVLTSGGAADAMDGMGVLKMLVEKAAGRIDVIVGGGVRSGNLGQLRRRTGASWFHSSAVLEGEDGVCGEEVVRLKESITR